MTETGVVRLATVTETEFVNQWCEKIIEDFKEKGISPGEALNVLVNTIVEIVIQMVSPVPSEELIKKVTEHIKENFALAQSQGHVRDCSIRKV